jgi:hypothetical protein
LTQSQASESSTILRSDDNNNIEPPAVEQETSTQNPPKARPAWITAISKPDNRTQPWRTHHGIAEDVNFADGKDIVRMEEAEYPGGSLAA